MPTPKKKTTPAGGHTPGPVCKHCGKPGRADASGKMQHERRDDPAAYGGRRKDPATTPKSGEGDEDEREPEREHFLNRKVGGASGRAE